MSTHQPVSNEAIEKRLADEVAARIRVQHELIQVLRQHKNLQRENDMLRSLLRSRSLVGFVAIRAGKRSFSMMRKVQRKARSAVKTVVAQPSAAPELAGKGVRLARRQASKVVNKLR